MYKIGPNQTPLVSFVYFTYRPGGMDMLANSMSLINDTDYELVVVDDYSDRDMTRAFEGRGIQVAWWGKSKPKTYPDTPFNQINALNTGLLHTRGDIIVVLEDFEWVPHTAVRDWVGAFMESDGKTLITGVGTEWEYKPPELLGDFTIWNQPITEEIWWRKNRLREWNPAEWEWFYSGIPASFLEKTNGLDEQYDYWREYPATHFPILAKSLGYKFKTDYSLHIDMVDHRTWGTLKPEYWHINRTSNVSRETAKPLLGSVVPAPNNFSFRDKKCLY